MGRRRLGGFGVKRGEIRWYTFRLPDKRRPVLILTRNAVIDRLNEIIVVPATRTIRGLTTEVVLTVDDGGCRPRARLISIRCRWRNGVAWVQSCAIFRKRDGLKCGMPYSSRAVSEDQTIEVAGQTRRRRIQTDPLPCRLSGNLRNAFWRRQNSLRK